MILRCDRCGIEIEGAENEEGEPCLSAPLSPATFEIGKPCVGVLWAAD